MTLSLNIYFNDKRIEKWHSQKVQWVLSVLREMRFDIDLKVGLFAFICFVFKVPPAMITRIFCLDWVVGYNCIWNVESSFFFLKPYDMLQDLLMVNLKGNKR